MITIPDPIPSQTIRSTHFDPFRGKYIKSTSMVLDLQGRKNKVYLFNMMESEGRAIRAF